MVSNVQLDDNIRIWLLEKEGFKSAPETWKCRHRNKVFGQSIPDPRSRNVEGPTTDCRQSEHLHHQANGAGRAECPSVSIHRKYNWITGLESANCHVRPLIASSGFTISQAIQLPLTYNHFHLSIAITHSFRLVPLLLQPNVAVITEVP